MPDDASWRRWLSPPKESKVLKLHSKNSLIIQGLNSLIGSSLQIVKCSLGLATRLPEGPTEASTLVNRGCDVVGSFDFSHGAPDLTTWLTDAVTETACLAL